MGGFYQIALGDSVYNFKTKADALEHMQFYSMEEWEDYTQDDFEDDLEYIKFDWDGEDESV